MVPFSTMSMSLRILASAMLTKTVFPLIVTSYPRSVPFAPRMIPSPDSPLACARFCLNLRRLTASPIPPSSEFKVTITSSTDWVFRISSNENDPSHSRRFSSVNFEARIKFPGSWGLSSSRIILIWVPSPWLRLRRHCSAKYSLLISPNLNCSVA